MTAHTLLVLTAAPLSLDNCSLPLRYGALVLRAKEEQSLNTSMKSSQLGRD